MDNKKLSQLDLFYRAFKEYKELVTLDLAFNRVRKTSRTINMVDNEDIILTLTTCKIENDWVEAIEKGLPYIEKCILEERQFIRTEGDVIPIEKVRKTSKQSVIDLSKHSNYISHLPDDDADSNLVPDKLLIINKDNEFSVYENRVLLACLEYLRDFISIRLNDIKGKINSYKAKSYINKKLKVGNYSFDYKMELNEERMNDPYVMKRSGIQDIVDRIEVCLGSVMTLLKTPLMVEVAKTERVKRPITKTNVLRMDHNFREMLAVYDYIAEYEGKGYEIVTTEKQFSPLTLPNVDDYTEIILLSSFITYMYASELDSDLEKAYQLEEKHRKEEKEKEILDRVEEIRVRIGGKEKTDKECLIILDEALKIYEAKLEEFEKKNKELEHKLVSEIELLNVEFERKKEEMIEAHRLEMEKKDEEHQEEIQNIVAQKDDEIFNIRKECHDHEEAVEKEAAIKIAEADQKVKEMEQKCEAIEKESIKVKAENVSLRSQNGLGPDPKELTSQERFDELEKMKMSLDALFEESWKLTKKEIRHRLFSEKPPKKVKKSKE